MYFSFFFFLMKRRPPRSTLDRSSAASDVYKRQLRDLAADPDGDQLAAVDAAIYRFAVRVATDPASAVSYTHLRAHETVLDLVCRLLLEK